MNKKNIKILIIILSLSILVIFILLGFFPPDKERLKGDSFSQIEAKPLSGLSEKKIKVSFIVQDKKYEAEINEGATVFEVMQKIQKESGKDNLFDFKYKEHAGLGIFIDEISGKRGGRDGYWIYYVNEKEANVGVSNYKIKNGDVISWKYEK